MRVCPAARHQRWCQRSSVRGLTEKSRPGPTRQRPTQRSQEQPVRLSQTAAAADAGAGSRARAAARGSPALSTSATGSRASSTRTDGERPSTQATRTRATSTRRGSRRYPATASATSPDRVFEPHGLHLVRHRSSLKQRVHAVLLAHGKPCPVSDLFGVRGRQLLARLTLPEPWQGTVVASLRLIDELDREIDHCQRELRRLGADHRYVPLLCTVPGVGWVLAYTIAAEIGDIGRFPSPRKLAGYSGLCPRVYQSGESDRRARSPRTDPATSAGHSSRPPPTPAPTPLTASAINGQGRGSANSAAPRSPRSTSPADSPKRSGTCSPATNPSLRQAPPTPWPPDGP